MERYSHLQAMPNSPLSPLTPLSENTKFEFNFGGDGSLDVYIDSVRQEHRVEQQQKKLLQQANKIFHKKGGSMQPKRYSEEFLKIRDVFEAHEQIATEQQICSRNCKHHKEEQPTQPDPYCITPKAPIVKITHTGATPTPTKNHLLNSEYAATPTNVRTPLKPRNHNVPQNIHSKSFHALQQQKLQQKCLHIIQQQQKQQHHHHCNQQQQQMGQHHHLHPQQKRVFRQASPVAAKPLCPQVAKILQQRGLSMYCGIFQREEIDLFTFQLLKLHDLHQMGITNQKHCAILMHDIYYAGQYF
ncbi:giant nuclei [Cochliomyia hominivorax]